MLTSNDSFTSQSYNPDMHSAKPSRTALGVARHRAAHQLVDGGRIFADPLAVAIAMPACVDPDGALVRTARGLGICLGDA